MNLHNCDWCNEPLPAYPYFGAGKAFCSTTCLQHGLNPLAQWTKRKVDEINEAFAALQVKPKPQLPTHLL